MGEFYFLPPFALSAGGATPPFASAAAFAAALAAILSATALASLFCQYGEFELRIAQTSGRTSRTGMP